MKRRNRIRFLLVGFLSAFLLVNLSATGQQRSVSAEGSVFDSFRYNPDSKDGKKNSDDKTGVLQLPDALAMQSIKENGNLRLKADAATGHFMVEDKRSGQVWYSFPDPESWPKETTQGVWRENLVSPLQIQFVDPKRKNDSPRSGNLISQKGSVEHFTTNANGFQFSFVIDSLELEIPVEVRLMDDGVETKVISEGIKEGKIYMTSLQLYPYFGAYQSTGQDGYLFIPDGSGALIRFNENRNKSNYNYASSVYGIDFAVQHTSDFSENRFQVNLPVLGVKSGEQGMIAVLDQGAEYAQVKATPSGHLTMYNAVNFELLYRESYWQPTTTNEKERSSKGYNVYPKERYQGDRSVRYYLLEKGQADYSGMAARFRDYLIEEKGFVKQKAKPDLPLYLDLLGGDMELGVFFDRYRKATDTKTAKEIVDQVRDAGVKNMVVRYLGWQSGGFSSYGVYNKTSKKIGGNKGMKTFINQMHDYDIPVYLHAVYNLNNSKHFNERKYGLVDQGNTVISYKDSLFGREEVMVSPKYAQREMDKDMELYQDLGADGISFHNIGNYLNSDFKRGQEVTRSEALNTQVEMLRASKEKLGLSAGRSSNLYAVPYMNHIYGMADGYSFDLFSDEEIPFMQMVLHGFVSYSFNPVNERELFVEEFLRSIEYGAVPNFAFSGVTSDQLKDTFELRLSFNNYYKEWLDVVQEEYRKFNDALGNVQDEWMVGHRTVANQVKEVTYSNGKRIIVNYRKDPFQVDGVTVPPRDFVIVEGGAVHAN